MYRDSREIVALDRRVNCEAVAHEFRQVLKPLVHLVPDVVAIDLLKTLPVRVLVRECYAQPRQQVLYGRGRCAEDN
ncbi:hypothetical protein ACFX2I_009415 [Malus domestica]